MISHLPRWLEVGAFILALVAGLVNVVGLLGFDHQAVSHLSGTASVLGSRLGALEFGPALHLAGILFAFLCGAAVSGLMLKDARLKLGRQYGTLLLLESALLLLSVVLLSHDSALGHYTASAACGLQNALATTYSGAIIRTTHVTGIFTDLGLMLGARLRGERLDRRKALLFVLIIAGFVTGGTVGTLLFGLIGFNALLVPAAICVVLAAGYRGVAGRRSRTTA